MKKLLIALATIGGLVLALTIYVGLTAGLELRRARAVLTNTSLAEIDRADVVAARSHLARASQQLRSLPAQMLRLLPVARQNIDALRAVADGAVPVLSTGLSLEKALDDIDSRGLVDNGRIDITLLRDIHAAVKEEASTLGDLIDQVRHHRTGWLVPPLWAQMDSFLTEYGRLSERVGAADDLLARIDALLGAERPRRYLVMLINNAELRGAGGILSGVGTIQLDNGKFDVGDFYSVHELRSERLKSVPAPKDYARRFEIYKANTTLWLNTTYSPDVPDVAVVASRLFKAVTGIGTDGAFVIDPRGVTAMADPNHSIEIPELGVSIEPQGLADFIYSDAYARVEDQELRRLALLAAGERVMGDLVSGGLGGRDRLQSMADAFAGGHVRFVSFVPAEESALDALGISGDLSTPDETIPITVTQQNLGSANGSGNKLDFWTDRQIAQACDVDVHLAKCVTGFHVANDTPKGLIEYVAGKPYGMLRTYAEIYVPEGAQLTNVTLDGTPVEYRNEVEEGSRAVGVFLEIEPGDAANIQVDWELAEPPIPFRLSLRPQPLARDASIDVFLRGPGGWVARGPEGGSSAEVRYEGAWDAPVDVSVEPDPRGGLPGLWARLTRFWSEGF